jgi:peptide/nickel transport system substrate-binding protein
MNRNIPMPYVPVGIDLIDQWRQIGVTAEHEQLETRAYLANLRGLNYDVGLDFNCDFMDEPNIQLAKYLSADVSPINYAGYNDPKLDELYEQQSRETDPERRAEILRQFEEHLFEQSYIVPSIWWHRIIVHLAEMKNWYMSPSHYLNQDLQDVWLDQ